MPVAGINTGKELERDAKERISHQTGRNDADSLGFSHGTREQATVEREQIKAVNPSQPSKGALLAVAGYGTVN
jgi:hypothetical protein